MVLELIFGFAVLVAASYIGTTMALRGFFDDIDVERDRPDRDDAAGSDTDGE